MIIRPLLFVYISFLSSSCLCQQTRYASFELAGAGGVASFNYEKTILKKESLNLVLRTGISFTPIDKNNGIVIAFPIMAHAVYGVGAHKIDLGIGQSPSITTSLNGIFMLMPLSLGYRYEPDDNDFYIRAAYTPLVSYLIDYQWQHWAGFTYGKRLSAKK